MLVISRKNGQKIMINDNIVITVAESKNGQCKLAIEADRDVKIYREEIYYQVKLANLIGKESNKNSVDSVSDLIKSSNMSINEDIKTETNTVDIVLEKPAKSIIHKKEKTDGE